VIIAVILRRLYIHCHSEEAPGRRRIYHPVNPSAKFKPEILRSLQYLGLREKNGCSNSQPTTSFLPLPLNDKRPVQDGNHPKLSFRGGCDYRCHSEEAVHSLSFRGGPRPTKNLSPSQSLSQIQARDSSVASIFGSSRKKWVLQLSTHNQFPAAPSE
jgi:hypothetical protein